MISVLCPGPRSVIASPRCLLTQFLAIVLISSSRSSLLKIHPLVFAKYTSLITEQFASYMIVLIWFNHVTNTLLISLWEADAGTVLACEWFVRDLGPCLWKRGERKQTLSGKVFSPQYRSDTMKGRRKREKKPKWAGGASAHCDMRQNLSQCHETKGAIEQLLVGQSVPLQAHSVLGLPRKSVSGLENYRRSKILQRGTLS